MYDEGYRQVLFIKMISSLLHTLKVQLYLQHQSSQKQRGNLLLSSLGRSFTRTWNPANPDENGSVQWWSPPFMLQPHRLLFKRNRGSQAAVFKYSWGRILCGGASVGDQLQPERGITSGLYATSGSGVCKAGKRKGLLWKEVDDVITEMLPHISSVLNVSCLVFCGQQYWLALDQQKQKELWSSKADFNQNLQVNIEQMK